MLRHKKLLGLLAVIAAVALLYATGVLPELPDPEQAITDIATALGPWTYVFVGGMAFLETGAFVGLVAPGETTVIVGGVIAGQGEISLIPLIGLVWLCCVLGDSTSFFIGRRLGRSFLLRHGPKIRVDEQRLRRVESYFDRHGGKTILIGRFIGIVRAVAPFVAGSSGLAYRRFLPFSIIGAGLWGALFCVLGFLFYRSFDRISAIAGKATLAFGITVALIVGGAYAYRRLRRPEDRRALSRWIERQGRRPLLRPLFAFLRPAWRRSSRPVGGLVQFIWHRLTPGHLGLELTTALAASAVGFYVFTLYTVLLADDPGTTPADQDLLDLADELHSTEAVDVFKVVTDLGSLPLIGTLGVGLGALLLVRRHLLELAALIAASLLLYVAVQLAKQGIDRPRPARPLDAASKASFPSGHAAYSTLWIGFALVAAAALRGIASRAALLAGGIAITVTVGLSRIYLRVHYWSDVAGGWALGAGILGACAAVAIIVFSLRQNVAEQGAPGGST